MNFHETFFDNCPVALLMHEPAPPEGEGRFLLVNRAACELLGYSAKEMSGLGLADIEEPGGDAEAALPAKEGESRFRKILVRKDGSKVAAEIRTTAGNVEGMPCLFSVVRALPGDAAERECRGKMDDPSGWRNRVGELTEVNRLLLEHSPAAVAIFDTEMRYLSASRRWLSDYNLAGRDLTGLSHYDVFPEITDELREAHRRGLAGEVVQGDAEPFFRADGSVQWVRWELRPWHRTEGCIGGIIIFSEIITELKETEAALDRYRLLAAHTRDKILFVRRDDGRILDANAAAVNGYGYDYDELLGLTVEELRAPETAGLKEQMAEADRRGILFETVHRRRDGSTFAVEVSSQGATIGGTRILISVIRDITERKRAEAALHDSERLYRAIGESIDYGVWVCEPDGRNIYASDSFLRLVGITQEQCSNFGWGDVLHPDDAENTIVAWKECVSTGGVWDIEHRFRGADGQWHPVLARGVPVRNESGELVAWAGINLDISRIKRAEEALQQKQAELLEAQSMAHIGSWRWYADTDATTGSEELLRIYGFDPATQEMPDFRAQRGRCYPVEDWERINAAVQDTLRTGLGYKLDVQAFRNMEQIWVTTRSEAVLDAEGRIVGLRGTVQDITELKRAEEALRESGARMRAVFRSLAEGVIFIDRDCVVQEVNEASERMGFTLQHLTDPKSDPRFTIVRCDGTPLPVNEQPSVVCLRTGQPVRDFEMGVVTSNGDLKWVSISSQPVRDEDGDIIGAVGSFFDITERKRVEEALRKSEEQFRILADAIPQLCWMANPDGWIFWYNRHWYEYTGTTAEQMEGWGWQSVHDPDVLPEVVQSWQASIASGELFEMTFPLRGNDGVFHPFLTRVLPLKDSSGQVLRWFGTNTDVSDLKEAEEELQKAKDDLEMRVSERTQDLSDALDDLSAEIAERCNAEEQLRQSEERFRKIFEEGPLSAIIANMERRFVKVNGRFCELLGYSAEELCRLTWLDVTEPADMEASRHFPGLLLEGKIPHFSLDKRFRRKDGGLVWATVTAWLMRDGSGTPLHFIATIENITEKKKLQERLLTSAKREERAKSRQAILEYQDRLRSLAAKLSVAQEEERRRIATELHDDIGQSLAFCKIRLGEILGDHFPSHPGLQEVRGVIEKCISTTRTLSFELSPAVLYEVGLEPAVQWLRRFYLQRHGLEVTVREENPVPEVPVPLRILLFQAVREFLANVAKHSKAAHAEVHISSRRGLLIVSVRDDGIGFTGTINTGVLGGYGLFNIEEQLRNVGGVLEFSSPEEGGACVTAAVPISKRKRRMK